MSSHVRDDLELKISGEDDVYVLSTPLTAIREEFIDRAEDLTEVTGAHYLAWAAAAESLRLLAPSWAAVQTLTTSASP